jgi:hypothetical protein
MDGAGNHLAWGGRIALLKGAHPWLSTHPGYFSILASGAQASAILLGAMHTSYIEDRPGF